MIKLLCPIFVFFCFVFWFSLPWNQTTPSGYFGEMICNLWFAESYLISNGAIIVMLLSMMFHHQAFYKMIHHTLDTLNTPDKNRDDKKLLCKLIRFHISIKECVFILNIIEIWKTSKFKKRKNSIPVGFMIQLMFTTVLFSFNWCAAWFICRVVFFSSI